jgi:lipopolysaccharide export system permease protein
MRMLVTLPLYVLRELGKALGLALLVSGLILIAFSAGQLVRDGAGFLTILQNVPNLVPFISPLALPVSVIVATIICYGRLSGGNEYVAALATGVHPAWLAAPALLVSLLAAMITIYLNADVLEQATRNIQRSLLSERRAIMERRLRRSGSFRFQNVVSLARLPARESLTGIDITFFYAAGAPAATPERWDPAYPHPRTRIVAQDHEIRLEETEEGALYVVASMDRFQRFDLQGSELQSWGAAHGTEKWVARKEESRINLGSPAYWSIGQILQNREEQEAKIAEATEELGAMDEAPPARVEAWRDYIRTLRRRLHLYDGELHRRLALSFACIVFAAVGVPLGLLSRRTSNTMGFAVGTGLAVIYYVVLKALLDQVELGTVGVLWLWVPNGALLALGITLWLRSRRFH